MFWVGVTAKNWLGYLASINSDEVNFWKPSGQGFGAIEVGAPFLFKLHSPINKIVGGQVDKRRLLRQPLNTLNLSVPPF